MKFSLRLNNDHRVRDYVRWAVQAEQAGFDQFWVSNDLFYRSAPVILTAAAAATRRIEVGTCILNPYTIHSAEIAMIAATLDEASNRRFNLGLSSGAGDFLAWVGIEAHKPRTAVVETVEAVNRLTTGQAAASEGDFLAWTAEAHMRFPALRRVPIYIGAMSPRMCSEIGRVADGGLPLLFPPEHYTQVIGHIEEGARQAGRSMDKIDVAACIWCSVSDNQAQAEDALKEKIAYYGHAMSATILEQLGLTHKDFSEIERLVMVEKDIEAAKRLVTAPMMRIGIAGSADRLIERLEQLAALGVRHISFGPPLGPDIDEAIRVIGQRVIPHFR
ncbi:MAG: LLM class flavin-dependent oxidoreductase [Anaerolineae bacterium]|nr:LLM class flavin-dependent oxidoreductase [Anaerolineae bacterium]